MKSLFLNRTVQMVLFAAAMAVAVLGGFLSPEVALAAGFAGSTLATTHPTLLDLTKRLDPNGSIATIGEMLHQTNEILEDMPFFEGNLTTGHRGTVRTGLPTPTWRKLYGGVQPTKSRTAQVTDACGMMEAYAEVDKALADMSSNAAAFRLSEDRAHIEGMNQEFASSLFYANEATEPEAFTGFGPRFNSLSAENGQQIISGSGAGSDNNSIWLVVWGANTVHGIYPKGSKAGLQQRDLGEVTIENVDGAGGRMQGYRSHYRWDVGLHVKDWRYVVRVANIDLSELTKNASAGADLIDLMTQAIERVQDLKMGRPAFYVSRTIRSFLRRQIANKVAASTLTMETVAGKKVVMFDEVPVRRCDALAANEAVVS